MASPCDSLAAVSGWLLAGKAVADVPRLVSVTRFAAVVVQNLDGTILVDDTQLDAVVLADNHHD